jgi:membrane protein implicated in regulation of membrane protease activity
MLWLIGIVASAVTTLMLLALLSAGAERSSQRSSLNSSESEFVGRAVSSGR